MASYVDWELFRLSPTSPSAMNHISGAIACTCINHTRSASLPDAQNTNYKVPPLLILAGHIWAIDTAPQTTLTISLLLRLYNPVPHLNVGVEGTRKYRFKGREDRERGKGFDNIHCSNSHISWSVTDPVHLHPTPWSTKFYF